MSQMDLFDIVDLGATSVKDGTALWQGVTKLSDEEGDVEPLGEGDVFQSLGVTSAPWPEDENGKAEAVAIREVAGRSTVYVGARDTRSAEIVGNLKPGDTVLHSTGPQQAAQVQLKEQKRQAALVSKNKNGRTMAVIVDGDGDKIQIVGDGVTFEMTGNGDVTITNGQASILLQGKTICLDGDVILGGTTPDPVNKIMASPAVAPVVAPFAAGTAGQPAVAAKGVFLAR